MSLNYIIEFINEGDLGQYIRKKEFLEQYEASFVVRQMTERLFT
jgi:hypothetical protein